VGQVGLVGLDGQVECHRLFTEKTIPIGPPCGSTVECQPPAMMNPCHTGGFQEEALPNAPEKRVVDMGRDMLGESAGKPCS